MVTFILNYKFDTQKSKVFLYTNNETAETEIRKKIPFDIATRKTKYLGINLTKEVKDLYSENYTTLKKAIKEDTNKWKLMDWKNYQDQNGHTTQSNL